MEEKILKNGVVGEFAGFRVGGKSYDAKGNPIEEKHDAECFCCRENIFKKSAPSQP